MRKSFGMNRHQRGRCDFCAEGNVFVERDLDTMIPTDSLRPALACERCTAAS